MKNIEKNFPKNLNSSENLKVGDKVLIKKNCLKKGKRLITQKYNLRDEKIIATLSNLYTNTLFSIKIDETINTFEEGEELIVNINQILYITDQECHIIKKDIEKKKLKASQRKYIKYKDKDNSKKKCKKRRKKYPFIN